MTQAVNWAARQGTGQFIDLGAGLPASPAVHQAARTVMPTARVAYVDIDPVVLSHARALLATSDGVTAVAADLRDPGAVLADPELRAVIDPALPVCVILGAVLHFMDADAARTVTGGYARLMAPGSCLVISVACHDDEGLGKQLAQEYTAAAWHNHMPADVTSFFAGLELVGPGVTEAQHGGRGCPSRYCGTARATCWPAWPGVKPDLQRASPERRRPDRHGPEAGKHATSSTTIFRTGHLTGVGYESGAAARHRTAGALGPPSDGGIARYSPGPGHTRGRGEHTAHHLPPSWRRPSSTARASRNDLPHVSAARSYASVLNAALSDAGGARRDAWKSSSSTCGGSRTHTPSVPKRLAKVAPSCSISLTTSPSPARRPAPAPELAPRRCPVLCSAHADHCPSQ